MSGFNKQQGKYGEDLACKFLAGLDYEIVERNYLIRGGEIDIIALDGDTTVIIEVKLRAGEDFGSAIESITTSKLRSLVRTCKFYALEKQIKGGLRIDLIAIDIKNGKPVVEHIKNITEGINIGFW
ncbi:MAG TPA: YraN family protein [Patescibacteria group bacterium]|nr:YraN family protein [Patescibacteria group bacterium]